MHGVLRYRFETVRESWPAVALVVGLTAFAVAVGLWQTGVESMPATPEQGRIVRFGSGSDYDGDHPLVLVRLRDGSTRQLAVSPSEVPFCRIDGPIALVRRPDNRISIGTMACRSSRSRRIDQPS